ncbi:hypothetical protein J6590_068414 [Homalodisca vitripennis]|nr:hypothetical protein J6590_068414 [Homalodisca vitripennis]
MEGSLSHWWDHCVVSVCLSAERAVGGARLAELFRTSPSHVVDRERVSKPSLHTPLAVCRSGYMMELKMFPPRCHDPLAVCWYIQMENFYKPD